MQKDTEKTTVVFRMWKAEPRTCIAFFPGIDAGAGLIQSYEIIGQHGGADYVGCIKRTRPAKPEEYAGLLRELESIGYNLVIRKRARR